MRARSLGLAHFSAIALPPTALVAVAAAAGFARVGLRLWPPFPDAPHYTLALNGSDIRELLGSLNGNGVEVYDIEAVVIDPSFHPPSLRPVLEVARRLGAKRLTVAGDDADTSRLTDNFARLCEEASAFDIAVDLENMGWRTVATFLQADAIVAASRAPNAGTLVDAIHFFRNGSCVADLENAMARVQSVQLCDVRGGAPMEPHAMMLEARSGRFSPGEGDLPLLDLLAALPRDVRLSVEVPMTQNGGLAHEHVAHLFRSTCLLLDNADEARSERPAHESPQN